MALTGQLSDLSLAELIEFFCNQRKTGRLKVVYPQSPGYFYIQAGSLVDAKIGALSGVEAVYYALTQPNASFKFSPAFEATRRTIYQPWTQVVLEGLRRLDEGIEPFNPFSGNESAEAGEEEALEEITENEVENLEAFKAARAAGESTSPLSLTVSNAAARGRSKALLVGASVVALLLTLAAIGVPAGWYGKKAPAAAAASSAPASQPQEQPASNQSEAPALSQQESQPAEQTAGETPAANNEAALAARREREARDRERLLRAAEERASETAAKQLDTRPTSQASPNPNAARKPETAKPAPRTVTVQVTYDESGRVTQASGGDPSAIRIARQKRFPTGKAGSTTVTIPIN
ncbi:MAG TPA: DUF4388 domain-containing protein [Pyrinomonadaceae bacterium]|jgi:chemotaxis protein histidine kinase CheA